MDADAAESRPNLEAAKRHLVRSSATVNERYLGPVSTSVQHMSCSAPASSTRKATQNS